MNYASPFNTTRVQSPPHEDVYPGKNPESYNMASRRGVSKRPVSSEELEYWSHAAESLSRLSTMYTNPSTLETIGRVNRLLSAWPVDDTLPTEGFDSVKSIYKKLISGLGEIKSTAERDLEAIDNVIERLDILIALRKASESNIPDKRKRPRGHSPPPVPTPIPPAVTPARSMSITLPPRTSVGPQASIPFSRDPKARREALGKQLPLQEGRKVAFHPPLSKVAEGLIGGKDEEWILAVVTKCINQDKNRYEVQDPEPQEDGQPGQCYNTTLRAIIPLPDPNASPDSAAHLNAYPEFTARSTVMALYPDTSCFYRAEVIASPRDMQPGGRTGPSAKQTHIPMYKLKFEDDDDQEHCVSAQWVVEWPGLP
ncbi:SAGA-associated factor 29 [Grifola frondosa]|uniref:SAGA-associated factor 29 n=1 Tax=Grifola frondosa TaxID=5627 RepID=A0A1C7M3V1_GRIFR|nr:SAGA-associated factor 29 [Grifola frondosa]